MTSLKSPNAIRHAPLAPSDLTTAIMLIEINGQVYRLAVASIQSSDTGKLDFVGGWDASTGAAPSDTPAKNQYWIVTTAGATALDDYAEWAIGDFAIYNGAAWLKIDNTDAVTVSHTFDMNDDVTVPTGEAIAAYLGANFANRDENTATFLGFDMLGNPGGVPVLLSSGVDEGKMDPYFLPASVATETYVNNYAIPLGWFGKMTGSGVPVIIDGIIGAAFLPNAQPGGIAPLNGDLVLPGGFLQQKISDLGTVSGSTALSVQNHEEVRATLAGNWTITGISGAATTGYTNNLKLVLTQDATGGRTITWPSTWLWPGGAPFVLSTAPGAVDVITLVVSAAGVRASGTAGWKVAA